MLQSHHLALHRLLVAIDLLLLWSAVALADHAASLQAFAWFGARAELTPVAVTLQFGCLVIAWLTTTNRLEVYRSRRTQGFLREFGALVEAGFLTLAIGALLGHALHGGLAFVPIGTFAIGLVLLTLLRATIRFGLRSLRVRGWNYRRALLVGSGPAADQLLTEVGDNPHYGIQVIGGLTFGDELEELPAGIHALGHIDDAKRVLTDRQVDYVLLCPPPKSRSEQVQSVFELCNDAGIACHYAPQFLRLRNLHPTVAWYGTLPAVAFQARPFAPWQLAVKRVCDVTTALLSLVILAPVMALIALLIKLQDGGPVFFVQERVGRRGRTFACYKFRTMCPEAERLRPGLEHHNEQDGPAFKIKVDPRVTRIGAFLRRYCLDELPQLGNVLAGDMSMVGPRPPIPAEVQRYDWWQRRRISVSPGMTCIWQVFGRPKRVSFQQWMEMDLYYVDHWSLWMDFKLMLLTVGSVVRGRGS